MQKNEGHHANKAGRKCHAGQFRHDDADIIELIQICEKREKKSR